MQKTFVAAVVICVVLAVAAVSTQQKTSLAKAAPGTFVWHDLATTDPAKSRAFYGALFGWTFEAGEGVDPGYTIIRQGDRPIGGIVLLKEPDAVAQWLSYVVVPNVDQATEAFRKAGGRVYRGPLNARKDLRVSVVADAHGAPIGLASRGPQLDEETPPAVNRWLWMEYVAARDPDAALKFYGDVVGFTNKVSEQRENFTYFLLSTDRPRAGLFRSPWERETSVWLPYVRVADPDALAARAVQLGGTVVLQPRPNVRNGSLAIVLDPTGAPLALQKYPFAAGVTP
jgi:predicted enzyme related to lactoylglutathione lyase